MQIHSWQRELAHSVRDPAVLLEALDLPDHWLPAARQAAERFGLWVPRPYLALMRRGDPEDPLLRQVLPLAAELRETPGFLDDPVGDLQALRGPGLLRKYAGRALLLASPACAIHCRYCFRRALPRQHYSRPRQTAWERVLEPLRQDPDTREVILSGGDPLCLDDPQLDSLLQILETLPQLRRVRIHTRLPLVIPARVTPALCQRLARSRLAASLVLHCNHPREISPQVLEALEPLRGRCALLNQSVLLRGVNDSAPVLMELSERLFDAGVLPYYIHLLDQVRGAAHFQVPEQEGRAILRVLRQRLPGYLVPRLVREQPGADAKLPVAC